MHDGLPKSGREYIAVAVAHNDWGAEAGKRAVALAAQLDDALVDELARLLIAVEETTCERTVAAADATWEAVKRHFPGLVPALDLVYCHVHGDAIAADCQAHKGPPTFERNGCIWRRWPPDPAASGLRAGGGILNPIVRPVALRPIQAPGRLSWVLRLG
jgi:hypothetical protein